VLVVMASFIVTLPLVGLTMGLVRFVLPQSCSQPPAHVLRTSRPCNSPTRDTLVACGLIVLCVVCASSFGEGLLMALAMTISSPGVTISSLLANKMLGTEGGMVRQWLRVKRMCHRAESLTSDVVTAACSVSAAGGDGHPRGARPAAGRHACTAYSPVVVIV
jgi:hypothetical protein